MNVRMIDLPTVAVVPLDVRVECLAGCRLVHVAGEVDVSNVDTAAEPIRRELVRHPEILVLDLLPVTFFASAGLRMLLQARTVAWQAHTVLHLAAGPLVLRSMELTGLDLLFAVHATVAEAVMASTQPSRNLWSSAVTN